MGTKQSSPVDIIEEWRRKASDLSSTDRIGNIIVRSLEVLKGLARKEISFPDLEYALESLEMERTLALKHDKAKDNDPVRSLMYGVIESIGLSVNTMLSLERIKKSEERTVEDPLMPQLRDATTSPEHRSNESIIRQDETEERMRLPLAPSSSSTGDMPIKGEDSPAEYPQQAHAFPPIGHIKEEEEEEERMEEQATDIVHSTGWAPFGSIPPPDEPSTSRMSYPPAPMTYGTGMTLNRALDGFMGASTSAEMYGGMYGHPGTNQPSMEQPVEDQTVTKPFHCEICGRSFSGLKWLQNHKRIHHQETPGADRARFVCSFCGQRFTDRSNHRRHVKRQHELKCVVCEEKFDTLGEYKEHGRMAHGEGQQQFVVQQPLPRFPQ